MSDIHEKLSINTRSGHIHCNMIGSLRLALKPEHPSLSTHLLQLKPLSRPNDPNKAARRLMKQSSRFTLANDTLQVIGTRNQVFSARTMTRSNDSEKKPKKIVWIRGKANCPQWINMYDLCSRFLLRIFFIETILGNCTKASTPTSFEPCIFIRS